MMHSSVLFPDVSRRRVSVLLLYLFVWMEASIAGSGQDRQRWRSGQGQRQYQQEGVKELEFEKKIFRNTVVHRHLMMDSDSDNGKPSKFRERGDPGECFMGIGSVAGVQPCRQAPGASTIANPDVYPGLVNQFSVTVYVGLAKDQQTIAPMVTFLLAHVWNDTNTVFDNVHIFLQKNSIVDVRLQSQIVQELHNTVQQEQGQIQDQASFENYTATGSTSVPCLENTDISKKGNGDEDTSPHFEDEGPPNFPANPPHWDHEGNDNNDSVFGDDPPNDEDDLGYENDPNDEEWLYGDDEEAGEEEQTGSTSTLRPFKGSQRDDSDSSESIKPVNNRLVLDNVDEAALGISPRSSSNNHKPREERGNAVGSRPTGQRDSYHQLLPILSFSRSSFLGEQQPQLPPPPPGQEIPVPSTNATNTNNPIKPDDAFCSNQGDHFYYLFHFKTTNELERKINLPRQEEDENEGNTTVSIWQHRISFAVYSSNLNPVQLEDYTVLEQSLTNAVSSHTFQHYKILQVLRNMLGTNRFFLFTTDPNNITGQLTIGDVDDDEPPPPPRGDNSGPIPTYMEPLKVSEWDVQRYCGLYLLVAISVTTGGLVLLGIMQQRKQPKEQENSLKILLDSNLNSQEGLSKLLSVRWIVKGDQMEIYYCDEDYSRNNPNRGIAPRAVSPSTASAAASSVTTETDVGETHTS